MFFSKSMNPSRMRWVTYTDGPRWHNLTQEKNLFPALKLFEEKDRFIMEARLPGVTADGINVTVQGKTVYLEGKCLAPELPEGSRYHRQERSFGSFRRALTLPVEIDVNEVKATQQDGMLRLELPKDKAVMPRQIKVN